MYNVSFNSYLYKMGKKFGCNGMFVKIALYEHSKTKLERLIYIILLFLINYS